MGDHLPDRSIIAGALGFTGLSATAARISKILFAIFFVLFLLVGGLARARRIG